ncbi:MAG TPA: hypothetical protein VFF68_08050, partial [Anaerolineaceae bacterium]|nr:hypothetical protein [Anaerolineaceae bacterium]
RYHKPPVYSSKLQVTEKQRLHANLLESMIGEVEAPLTPERTRRSRSSVLPTLLIGVLLIAVLSYVLTIGALQLPLPNLFPAEAAAFQSTLQSVAAASEEPVLVVVDYQPAFSAELETAASIPLHDLTAAGARLAFVSTSPTGPVLSSRLIDTLAAQNPAFLPAESAMNLGYLAGGSTGMQAFSLQPSLAVISTFEGQDAWGSPMLSGVETLDDFGAVLILTDAVENGRDWIEQVQPSLTDTPMLMVASAQSAPLLQPYVSSGQLSGLLSGWYGGISYNLIGENPSQVETKTWTAYQVGIALLVVLIGVGGLVQGIVSLVSARKKEPGA